PRPAARPRGIRRPGRRRRRRHRGDRPLARCGKAAPPARRDADRASGSPPHARGGRAALRHPSPQREREFSPCLYDSAPRLAPNNLMDCSSSSHHWRSDGTAGQQRHGGTFMKGIVFNVLEEVVVANYGEAVWDDLLDAAGSDGVYTSLGTYPDDHIMRLVKAASDALGIPPMDVVRWFGRQAIPRFAERYPVFFTAHTSTRPFVLALNTIIHPEVRKIYTGA